METGDNSPGRRLVSLPAWCGTDQGHCDGQGSAGPIVARPPLSQRGNSAADDGKITSHGGFYLGTQKELGKKVQLPCLIMGISAIHRMESDGLFNFRFFSFMMTIPYLSMSTSFHMFPHFQHVSTFFQCSAVDDLRKLRKLARQVPAIVWRCTAPRASQSRQIGCPGWMRPGVKKTMEIMVILMDIEGVPSGELT